MAWLLYFVAGLAVGVAAGWLLWGRRFAMLAARLDETPGSEAITGNEPDPVAVSELITVDEPVAERQSAAVTEVIPITETVAETAAAAETQIIPVPEPATAKTVDLSSSAQRDAEPEPAAETQIFARDAVSESAAEPERAAEVEPEPAAAPAAAEADEVAASPAPVAVAVAEPDDLTKIAGIGPKIAMALAAGGITTYRQLADSDVTALRAVIAASGLRSAPSLARWPERAKQLIGTAS